MTPNQIIAAINQNPYKIEILERSSRFSSSYRIVLHYIDSLHWYSSENSLEAAVQRIKQRRLFTLDFPGNIDVLPEGKIVKTLYPWD